MKLDQQIEVPPQTTLADHQLVTKAWVLFSSGLTPTPTSTTGYAEPVMSGNPDSKIVLTDKGDCVMVMVSAS